MTAGEVVVEDVAVAAVVLASHSCAEICQLKSGECARRRAIKHI